MTDTESVVFRCPLCGNQISYRPQQKVPGEEFETSCACGQPFMIKTWLDRANDFRITVYDRTAFSHIKNNAKEVKV